MSMFDKIMGWITKAFSWVDFVIDRYNMVKDTLPGLVAYIEALYDTFIEEIGKGVMTKDEAREELLSTAYAKFNGKIRKSVIRGVLEDVHLHRTLPYSRVQDLPHNKREILDMLDGLENKYGDR